MPHGGTNGIQQLWQRTQSKNRVIFIYEVMFYIFHCNHQGGTFRREAIPGWHSLPCFAMNMWKSNIPKGAGVRFHGVGLISPIQRFIMGVCVGFNFHLYILQLHIYIATSACYKLLAAGSPGKHTVMYIEELYSYPYDVYIYNIIHIYIYIYIYIHTYIYAYTFVCILHVCMYIYIFVHHKP